MVDPVFVVSRLEGKDGGQGAEKGGGGVEGSKAKNKAGQRSQRCLF